MKITRQKKATIADLKACCVIDAARGCWLWQGKVNEKGYGRLRQNYALVFVHRLAWEFANGEVPEGLNVCHHCDVRHCINPEHLFLGTHKDNMQDCLKKGRTHGQKKTHCAQGHPWIPENIYQSKYGRSCKVCRRNRT